MSLEQAIADLTVAVNANTAALGKGGSAASTPKGAGKTTPAADAKPKNERAAVATAVTAVKDKKGTPAAKALIKEFGGAEKMADVPDANLDALFTAAEAALAEEDGGL